MHIYKAVDRCFKPYFVLKRKFDAMGSIAAVMVPFLSKLIPGKRSLL